MHVSKYLTRGAIQHCNCRVSLYRGPRFRNMVDKTRESRLLPNEEIAHIFGKNANLGNYGGPDEHTGGDTVLTAASSITLVGDEERTAES